MLVGTWVVDESDRHALAELGDVLLEFNESGGLTYVIRGDGKQQVILMQYEVEGDTIITDQPSAPRVERTKFSFSDDGTLVLAFGGEPFTFKRAPGD
jgi:hypothetical protein